VCVPSYQAVGLLCRETLISTALAVYDAQLHPTLDGVAASRTDAKRMLEAYIAKALGDSVNEHVRKHARAALDLNGQGHQGSREQGDLEADGR
jgi:hypothetical protein